MPYVALYRVIVIGGQPMRVAFKDVPTQTRWRVSVCLNQHMTVVKKPCPRLLRTAVKAQRAIHKRGVHFIDVFETANGSYYISEINTACSLLPHERKRRRAGVAQWNIAHQLARYYLSEFAVPLK